MMYGAVSFLQRVLQFPLSYKIPKHRKMKLMVQVDSAAGIILSQRIVNVLNINDCVRNQIQVLRNIFTQGWPRVALLSATYHHTY